MDNFPYLSPIQNSDLRSLHGKLMASREVSRDQADAKIAEFAETLRIAKTSVSVAKEATPEEIAAKLDKLQESVDAIAARLDRK